MSSIIRESIEWLRVWVPDSVEPEIKLPRVLLVGDSIAMGYGPEVTKFMEGKASIAWLGTSRFPTDSAFVDEILLVLRHTRFDLIHFNNGLHGFDNSDEDYAASLPKVLATLRAASQGANWILANTTPQRTVGAIEQLHPHMERIRYRNLVMEELARREGLLLNDLCSVVKNRPDLYCEDAIHFKPEGDVELARVVSASITPYLRKTL